MSQGSADPPTRVDLHHLRTEHALAEQAAVEAYMLDDMPEFVLCTERARALRRRIAAVVEAERPDKRRRTRRAH